VPRTGVFLEAGDCIFKHGKPQPALPTVDHRPPADGKQLHRKDSLSVEKWLTKLFDR
jgi:hypothetical protein